MTEEFEQVPPATPHPLLFAMATDVTCLVSGANLSSILPTVFDSASTHHMINDKKFIQILNEVVKFQVSTGLNSNYLNNKEIGQALLKNKNSHSIFPENAMYVPCLNRNLISLTRLFAANIKITKDKENEYKAEIVFDFK